MGFIVFETNCWKNRNNKIYINDQIIRAIVIKTKDKSVPVTALLIVSERVKRKLK